MKPLSRYFILALLVLAVGAAFYIGKSRLAIDSDITSALPQSDPVVAAARQIVNHHPALENIFIDLSLKGPAGNREDLVKAADLVRDRINQSGLAKAAGREDFFEFVPLLQEQILGNLPLFFSSQELSEQVAPLVAPDRVRSEIREQQRKLMELGGLGQARLLARDPLGLSNLVLGRLSEALPLDQVEIYQGHLFSPNGQSVLIVAEPIASGADTAAGRRLEALLKSLAARFEQGPAPMRLTYAGAFRAALDNENIIKRDAQKAVALVTVGLILLVLLCFRRPWIGALSVLPAVFGFLLAVFAYSLLKNTIFAVSLGFAGALVSIAVDHGLAFVLHLDRPEETRGREVAKDVWSVSSFTVYTTVAALLSLVLSGIPLFEQVGLFAALGVGLAALSVHVFLPLLFPKMKPARRGPRLPLDRVLSRLAGARSWAGPIAAGLAALGLLFFIRLDFNADLARMNTVTPGTLAAEETISSHWGDLAGKTYFMAQAASLDELVTQTEKLEVFLTRQKKSGVLARAFPRASVFPGPHRCRQNLDAWKKFWTPERRQALETALNEAGQEAGFKPNAFKPFIDIFDRAEKNTAQDFHLAIPSEIHQALGIFKDKSNQGWLIVDAAVPGPKYDAGRFFDQAASAGFAVFDGQYFAAHLAGYLNQAFLKMLAVIGLAAAVLIFFLFTDLKLVLLTLAPLAFALIATLGLLGLLGRPLSIPALMLAPVVIGLGLDYGLYLVRSRQRFGDQALERAGAFRSAVLLGGLSTLIGFGSLLLSKHQVLQDAGLTTFLGIAFAMIGTFAIIPPFLNRLFQPAELISGQVAPGSPEHLSRVLHQYRRLEPYPRMFARFKIKFDPMFPRLADFIKPGWKILDLGCGFAVPAVWLSCLYSGLKFISLEPDPERARVASRVLGDRAEIRTGLAQDLDLGWTGPVEAALMLDMAHYLSDLELEGLLEKIYSILRLDGRLVIRTTIAARKKSRWLRWLEVIRLKFSGRRPYFRTKAEISYFLTKAGFVVSLIEPASPTREELWFLAAKEDVETTGAASLDNRAGTL